MYNLRLRLRLRLRWTHKQFLYIYLKCNNHITKTIFLKKVLQMTNNITDKLVLVTGSTDGIGKQTALDLAGMGANVLIHGRDEERCKQTLSALQKATGRNDYDYFVSDFSSLKNVKKLADELIEKYDKLDVLINNVGVYMKDRILSDDGYEMTFAVNHLAPFLLTNELIPLIKKSNYARIVNVSSTTHHQGDLDFDDLMYEKSYEGYRAYCRSKLANILFTNELSERLKDTHLTANSLHPGAINTKLLHAAFNMQGASVKKGAETSVYLASSEKAANITGKYFENKKMTEPSSKAKDKTLQKELWEVSEKLVKIF